MFTTLSLTSSSLLRGSHPRFLVKMREVLLKCWLGKPLCLSGQSALVAHQVAIWQHPVGMVRASRSVSLWRADWKYRIVASECMIEIWNRFLQVRWLVQLQLASIHHIMDAKLRWEIQLEGIRTHLLYDGVCTTLNGLELVMLLIFIVVLIQMQPNSVKNPKMWRNSMPIMKCLILSLCMLKGAWTLLWILANFCTKEEALSSSFWWWDVNGTGRATGIS